MEKPLQAYTFFKELQALPFVEEIWLFGSRARGDHQSRSDIDLAFLCPKANDKDWNNLLSILEKADTLLHIDAIRFDTLSPEDPLRINILRFKTILYKKNPTESIFWRDYFYSLGKAIERLKDVMMHSQLKNEDYLQDAAIQRFEFVTELFWKVLKKILTYEKIEANTPREVLNKAYTYALIDEEALWLRMLTDRNLSSHVYKEEEAKRVFDNIQAYLPVYIQTYRALKLKYDL